jgi:hypothetical protein
MSSLPPDVAGRWYSTFKSPTGSIHYLTLDLKGQDWKDSMITLAARRVTAPDQWARPELTITSILPCHAVPAVSLMAQETENPEGVFSMIIKFDEEARKTGGGVGRILWLSLTDEQVRAELLFFSRSPTLDHPEAV